MANATHTPGPWRVGEGRETGGSLSVLAKTPREARLPEYAIVTDVGACGPPEEARANAKLIAAAPSLADALEALLANDAIACTCSPADLAMGRGHLVECDVALAHLVLRAAGRL